MLFKLVSLLSLSYWSGITHWGYLKKAVVKKKKETTDRRRKNKKLHFTGAYAFVYTSKFSFVLSVISHSAFFFLTNYKSIQYVHVTDNFLLHFCVLFREHIDLSKTYLAIFLFDKKARKNKWTCLTKGHHENLIDIIQIFFLYSVRQHFVRKVLKSFMIVIVANKVIVIKKETFDIFTWCIT